MYTTPAIAIQLRQLWLYTCGHYNLRPSYGYTHEVRALVPQGTPFIACTARVTSNIWKEMIYAMEMINYEVVNTYSEHPNIYYKVLWTDTCIVVDLKRVLI